MIDKSLIFLIIKSLFFLKVVDIVEIQKLNFLSLMKEILTSISSISIALRPN